MRIATVIFALATLVSASACTKTESQSKVSSAVSAAPQAAAPSDAAPPGIIEIQNSRSSQTTVFIAFGSDSVVNSGNVSLCSGQPTLNCSFPLAPNSTAVFSAGSQYTNLTLSFAKPVTCNTTKAELNVNNPKWYDTTDVSLVDGFDNVIELEVRDASGSHNFEARSATGNEKAFGVFPLGCDICTARQSPPCGMKPGKEGCKAGTQYKPDVFCQYQGPTMAGGSHVVVRLR